MFLIEKLCASGVPGGQGGASLAGARFAINFYHSNDATGPVVASRIFEAQAAGNRAFVNMENPAHMVSGPPMIIGDLGEAIWGLGSISVQEVLAPPGFLIDPNRYVGVIEINDANPWGASFRWLTDAPMVGRIPDGISVYNEAIHGGVRIEKWDLELDARTPQGDGTLAGAVFDIINRNPRAAIVNGVSIAPNQVALTLTTDANGVTQTDCNYILPYGVWEIVERVPPIGYLNTGNVSRRFFITQDSVWVELNTSETSIQNQVIRGDFEGVKIDDNGQRLARVPFLIESVTTGEAHVIVTDDNGEFGTSSDFAWRGLFTNRGLLWSDGVWFGGRVEKWSSD